MGLLNRFRKNDNVDDEDEDDEEIDDEEEDGEEEDEDDEEEAETGGGLFGKIRGIGGKLLGQGGDDDEDDDEDEDDYDEGPAASPSPPVQTVPEPLAEIEETQQNLTASLEGVTFEDPVSPSPNSEEILTVSHKALISLAEEDPSGDSAGAPDQTGLTSEETLPEEDDSSEVGLKLGDIFEKRVEIDQKLKSLAMSQEETPAEFLATELHDLLRELEELTPS